MNDEDNDKIVKGEESINDEAQSEGEKQPLDESKPIDSGKSTTSGQEASKSLSSGEKRQDHQVIHKKDGRLHIYVRQDKYKGELKSKNWVGRLYVEGKQKISSSGTTNLEEAIPILEKWFDDIHAQKEKEKEQTILEQSKAPQQTAPTTEQPITAKQKIPKTEKIIESDIKNTNSPTLNNETPQLAKLRSGLFKKFKNIKFSKPSIVNKKNKKENFFLNLSKKFSTGISTKLGKSAVKTEEIIGVEISNNEIRLAQVSKDKENDWMLEKFTVHTIQGLDNEASVQDNIDKISQELTTGILKGKFTTSNCAIAIPVTSAIIRVVTSPLMNDEELKKAIDTDSLWENLVQLTDNLSDYSIFHQVISRQPKNNTMDILFVASKLSDISAYTTIAKKAGLNPVIIDVKCFALKSAVDNTNQISDVSKEEVNQEDILTAVLEFGVDENYVMILHQNNPIITDIFLRAQDKKTLVESINEEEMEGLIRRYVTQVKQAVNDYETKFEKRIRSLRVVSNVPKIDHYLGKMRRNLPNTGFNLFNPLSKLKIPAYLIEATKQKNTSYFSTSIGLAFRKLDVFGYYKFVTAVKNINLLPNRENLKAKSRFKAFSNFAFYGLGSSIVALYIILFSLSFWQISSYNKRLADFNMVEQEHQRMEALFNKNMKEQQVMKKALIVGNKINSNQSLTYRVMAQIASSVPKRVRFTSITFMDNNTVQIKGEAYGDNDILKLISNLNQQRFILQASLASMNLPKGSNDGKKKSMKAFRINCTIGKEVS